MKIHIIYFFSGLPSTFRQHSTTEYLPGMIHSESIPGLLPKFPSCSVCCLGKATIYNHSQGLDFPGFLHGSHFLLPWDITVKAEKDKWPSVGETASRKGKQKKSSKGKSCYINQNSFLLRTIVATFCHLGKKTEKFCNFFFIFLVIQ